MNWTAGDGINYECACETINFMIALHISAIDDEERKPSPDAARIASLEANVTRLVEERRALSVIDQAALRQVVDGYASFVRSHLGVDKAVRSGRTRSWPLPPL